MGFQAVTMRCYPVIVRSYSEVAMLTSTLYNMRAIILFGAGSL